MTDSDEVRCERRGAAGVIVLNRPAALNALTLGMVRGMRRALDAWAGDPAVTRIVLTGAGGKAFCAGGDVRRLHDLGRAGDHAGALAFWREEYALNTLIHRYPKPYLSLVDGIVMGGGVGVSLHGRHRVAGERYVLAMPEVAIGFFPDVGATYALPRLPGETGTYLALTGDRIRAADACALGLATRAVPSAAIAPLQEALAGGEPVEAALTRFGHDPGPAPIDAHRAAIDRCFSADDVPAILSRLDEAASRGSEFAATAAATLRTKSPTSMALALEQMRRGGGLSFEDAMRVEFRIVSRIIEGHDFYEGVRAALIDRDGAPRWQPASLDGVRREDIERHFADLGPAELELP